MRPTETGGEKPAPAREVEVTFISGHGEPKNDWQSDSCWFTEMSYTPRHSE
jgi:hypothetical protein